MYYPAPYRTSQQVEWKTWQKMLNMHFSHIATQKRMSSINRKLYGLTHDKQLEDPSAVLSGKSMSLKKYSKSSSAGKADKKNLKKILKEEIKNNNITLRQKIAPVKANFRYEEQKQELLNINQNIENGSCKASSTPVDGFIQIKATIKIKKKEFFPNIAKPKTEKLAGVCKKTKPAFHSFDLKREIGTPRPWKLVEHENESHTNPSVAISTDNY